MFMTMHTRAAAAAAVLALSAGAAPAQDRMDQGKTGEMEVEKVISGWPRASQEAVKFMTRKYGPPAAVANEMIVWGKTGPWKRTIVFAREYPHEFPAHHTDVMQQYIDYKADPQLYDELAKYDGSVVLERTSGEMSARCDKEGANFLALNLAHEIATGKRNVEDARKFYGEQIVAMKAGRPAPYTERLRFQPPSRTSDPDMSLTSMGASNPQ
jgi:hypothetical protein